MKNIIYMCMYKAEVENFKIDACFIILYIFLSVYQFAIYNELECTCMSMKRKSREEERERE
jgi:hypothetical protein